jgi:hypothetical protein
MEQEQLKHKKVPVQFLAGFLDSTPSSREEATGEEVEDYIFRVNDEDLE